MSSLTNEYARLVLRNSSANAHLAPSSNEAAVATMDLISRLQEGLQPWIDLMKVPGSKWRLGSRLAIPMLLKYGAESFAVAEEISIKKACGDGRLATIVDNVTSTGNAFGANKKHIEYFLGLNGDVDYVHLHRGGLNALFPVIQPGVSFNAKELLLLTEVKLKEREQLLKLRKEGHNLSRDTKRTFLIKKGWTASRIEEEVVEYLTRTLVHATPPEVRQELVYGDGAGYYMPLNQAIAHIRINPESTN
jgi:hypothetical protein